MKRTLSVAIIVVALLSGCSWFSPAEEYRSESGRTTYRAADENPDATATPSPPKIPGESKKTSLERQ